MFYSLVKWTLSFLSKACVHPKSPYFSKLPKNPSRSANGFVTIFSATIYHPLHYMVVIFLVMSNVRSTMLRGSRGKAGNDEWSP